MYDDRTRLNKYNNKISAETLLADNQTYLDALANFALALSLALNGNRCTHARARAHHFKNICTRARAQFLNLHSRSALKSENINEFFRGHF